MVAIEIEDGNAPHLGRGLERLGNGNGDVVKVAETHNTIPLGVVPGGAHQRESGPPAESVAISKISGKTGVSASANVPVRTALSNSRVWTRRISSSVHGVGVIQVWNSLCNWATADRTRSGFSGWPAAA